MARRLFFIMMLLALTVATVAEARTWRPVGRRAILGDFQDVKGTDVIIRTTTGGIETVPYAKLNKKDKEVVKSNLISMGRQSDVERLNRSESGDSSEMESKEGDSKGDDMADKDGSGEDTGMRQWTDINGNKLQAELVSVTGLTAQLKTATGEVQTFPITGFSLQDQQYLRAAADGESGAGQPGAGMPGVIPGVPGVPGGLPGNGFPGLPSMPGSVNPSTGLPGEMPGFPNMAGASGSMPPGSFPGAAMSSSINIGPGGVPGMSGPMIPPGGAAQPGISGPPGMAPGPFTEMNPSGIPGSFPGGTGHDPGMSGPPGMPPQSSAPDFSPPQFNPPQFNPPPTPAMPTFEYVYKCDNCGAEFSEADGVKTGDACPKCSGGSNFNLRGSSVRGLVALAALAAGGIGWAVKKATGKA